MGTASERSLTRHLAWRLGLPATLLIALSMLVSLGVLVMAAHWQDRQMAELSRRHVQAILAAAERDLGLLVRDYAWWDEAVDNLAGVPDLVWAADNIGPYLHESFDITAVLVVAPDGRVTLALEEGRPVPAPDPDALPGGLDLLLARSSTVAGATPEPATGLVSRAGAPHLAAACPLTYQDLGRNDPGQGQGILVFLRRLDAAFLDEIAGVTRVDALRLVDTDVPEGDTILLPLATPDGSALGTLAWQGPAPGREMLERFTPVMTVVLLVMLGLAAVLHRRLYQAARDVGARTARLIAHSRRLEVSEGLFRTVIHTIPELIVIIRAGRIAYVNQPGAAMLGAEAAELLDGRPVGEFLKGSELPTPYSREEPRTVGGLEWSEMTIWRLDGTSFCAEAACIRLGDDDDTVLLIARDVSEHRRIETSLREAKKQAELANRAKGQFLANMSHELRTPLNAIIGFSDIIADQQFGPVSEPSYVEYARDIRESGIHLLNIINDILDYSKIEDGRLELNEDLVDVGATVASAARLLAGRAVENGLRLEIAVDDNLPPLLADATKLKQILLNLLSNAVKFTPRGGQVTAGAHLDAGGDLLLTVADTGIGMTADEIAVALQPFRQVQNDLKRKYEGTGLGLPLVKALAERHDGVLTITSEPGRGTTVTVRFPARRVLHKPEDPALAALAADGGRLRSGSAGS